jgi:hypothetical protein
MQANTEHEDRIRRLLQGLEKTKEDEFKAVLRAQQYSRHLNDMDRGHLEALQEQKKTELNKLQKDREALEAEELRHATVRPHPRPSVARQSLSDGSPFVCTLQNAGAN